MTDPQPKADGDPAKAHAEMLERRLPQQPVPAGLTAAAEAICDARAAIEDAVALAADPNVPQKFLDYLRDQINELRSVLPSATADCADAIEERAQELGRYRAYVMSGSQLRAGSRVILDDLRDWRVPTASMADLTKRLQDEILNADLTDPAKLTQARATFESALDIYDYWDDYIEWYLGETKRASIVLLATAATSLVTAMLLLSFGRTLLGFLFAGVCGASVSMLASLPPISVYGEIMGLWTRILFRYGVGVAGTAVGCGLLALGILSFFPKNFDFQETMNGTGATPLAAAWPAIAVTKIAVLLAVGILLGFSERAMGSFEDRIFPPDNPKPTAPPS